MSCECAYAAVQMLFGWGREREGDKRVLLVPFLNCEPQTEVTAEVVCSSFGMEIALLLFLLYHGI